MNMMKDRHVVRTSTLVAVLALGACGAEPTEELQAAYDAQDAALTAAAMDYAPTAMEPVLAMRFELDTELAAQGERFALTRSYGRARELADSLEVLAAAAAQQAGTAREEARLMADAQFTALTTEATELRTALASAPQGKGSAADLAALAGDLDGVDAMLEEARVAYEAQDYRGTLAKLEAAGAALTVVRGHLGRGTTMAAGGTF